MLRRCVLLCLALLQPFASTGQAEGLNLYKQGQYEQAMKELKGPALQGDMLSQRLVGIMYLQGQGTEKDAVQAAYWFQEAAKQGDAAAQAYLGEMYLAGNGLPQDDISAVYNAQQSAGQGYGPGQVLLGRLYLDGRGLERDPQMALDWFGKAAAQGLAEGQYQLAQLLEQGEGVKRDAKQALKWYEAADAQDLKAAGEALKRLTGKPPTRPAPTPSPNPAPGPQPPPLIPQATPQKKRVALLLANQDYQDRSLDLTGPINDARLIESSLLSAGFKVTVKTNLNFTQMNREVSSFLAGVDGDTVSLVYYSGHGVELDGTNYLIPTDFKMTPTLTAAEAEAQSVDIATLYTRMSAEAAGSLNITILDACRNNPFKTRGLKGMGDGQAGLKTLSVPGGKGDDTIDRYLYRLRRRQRTGRAGWRAERPLRHGSGPSDERAGAGAGSHVPQCSSGRGPPDRRGADSGQLRQHLLGVHFHARKVEQAKARIPRRASVLNRAGIYLVGVRTAVQT